METGERIPDLLPSLLVMGGVAWAAAAWMTVGFIEECRDGWPWAGEVPLLLIATMAAFGGVLMAGGFGYLGP